MREYKDPLDLVRAWWRSFIVSIDGVVDEKDLGPNTINDSRRWNFSTLTSPGRQFRTTISKKIRPAAMSLSMTGDSVRLPVSISVKKPSAKRSSYCWHENSVDQWALQKTPLHIGNSSILLSQ